MFSCSTREAYLSLLVCVVVIHIVIRETAISCQHLVERYQVVIHVAIRIIASLCKQLVFIREGDRCFPLQRIGVGHLHLVRHVGGIRRYWMRWVQDRFGGECRSAKVVGEVKVKYKHRRSVAGV